VEPTSRARRRSVSAGAAAVVVYLGLGLVVMAHYLPHPDAVIDRAIPDDNAWLWWALEHGAYSVRHLSNPFYTHRMHVPDGVNMMANNSVLGVTIPLAPLTTLAGAKISYLVWTVAACAGTATSTYWALSRHLVENRVAAFIGGAFAGFAPGVVHHTNGQPNFATNFLLPLILVGTLRLATTEHWARDGTGLGLLIVWQLFISEELLLITSVTAGCLLIAYVVGRRTGARRVTAGLVVTGIVAGALAAYPLWTQFAGPQSYRGIPLFHDWGEDLIAFVTLPPDSLGGVAPPPWILATEQNTWYGWPLLIAVVLLWPTYRRHRTVVAVALIGAVGALGPWIRWAGHATAVPGPWVLEPRYLPVVSMMLPSRLAFVTTGALAVLLAIGWDDLARRARLHRGTRRADRARLAQFGVVAALFPLLPTPLPVVPQTRTPAFIASGAWRPYVPPGTSLVPVPPPDNSLGRDTLTWTVDARLAFPVPAGYFLGPDARGQAAMGGQWDYTSRLFQSVVARHKGPELTPARRAAVRRDLARWHASLVVLSPAADYVKPWLDDLLGPARRVDDVWLWEVPASASPSGNPVRSGSPSHAGAPAGPRSRSPRRPL
jgi:hypothetical protein